MGQLAISHGKRFIVRSQKTPRKMNCGEMQTLPMGDRCQRQPMTEIALKAQLQIRHIRISSDKAPWSTFTGASNSSGQIALVSNDFVNAGLT